MTDTSNTVPPPQSQTESILSQFFRRLKRTPDQQDQGLIPLQPGVGLQGPAQPDVALMGVDQGVGLLHPGFNAPWLPDYLIPMTPARGNQEAEDAQRQAQAQENLRTIVESAGREEELKRKAWASTFRQGQEAAAPPPWQPRPQSGPPAAESAPTWNS